uniref:Uncharacterized protein n=1 Tax=Panagrolaimus sp. PS1159 TaxID=55785 RepID=A0AC35G1Y6_9BILA
MDSEAFRKHGKEMVDLVADYWDSLRDRQPLPDVKPGFIWDLVPNSPPESPEEWSKILADVDPIVLQNNTNWHHPHFFAYFSTACSYPAIMGDILSGGISSIGFTWKSSPSMTELEMVMTDWLAKSIGLPEHFLNSHPGPGAGIIQSTASDATFVALLSARARAVSSYKENSKLAWIYSTVTKALPKLSLKDLIKSPSPPPQPAEDDPVVTFGNHDPSIISKLVAYCSDQAHSSVDKGIMLAAVKMRKLKIDQVAALGPICKRENIWLHVDAAYAGSFALCPEYRYLVDGFEFVDSFNFNPHKAMQINFDCSPMWFKDAKEATTYFNVEAEYLRHEYQAVASDYRHLQIALGRRFRSLKIWFVLRSMGIEKIQGTLRQRVKLAEEFADLISHDKNFEIIVPTHLGLVCFRYKGDNAINEKLVNIINDDRRIHLVPAKINGVFFLRLAICSNLTNSKDIQFAYHVIKDLLPKVL